MSDFRRNFVEQFRANVEAKRRQTPQRFLRMVFIIFLTAIIGGACTFVDRLTGSRVAVMLVGLSGVSLGLIAWLLLLHGLYPDDTPPGDESPPAPGPRAFEPAWSAEVPRPDPPLGTTGYAAPSPPFAVLPAAAKTSSSLRWWLLGCLGMMLLAGCGAPIGLLVLIMLGSRELRDQRIPGPWQARQAESIQERVRMMQEQHRQQFEEIQRRNEELRRDIELRHEELRRGMGPGPLN